MIVSATGRLELESIPGERTAYGTNYDGRFSYEMEDIKNLRLSSELAYSLDWTETSLFENFRVGVRWGKVCFIKDSKFGFTSSCWRKKQKPGWFVLLKSANCYCSKAFVCRHREVLRKEVYLLTGGGWNRTRPKLLTTGLQWVLPILPSLNLSREELDWRKARNKVALAEPRAGLNYNDRRTKEPCHDST